MSHTGENIARWVETECDKWGITEDVGVVTTDTAANMLLDDGLIASALFSWWLLESHPAARMRLVWGGGQAQLLQRAR